MNVKDEDLPPREELSRQGGSLGSQTLPAEKGIEAQETANDNVDAMEPAPTIPLHAGFDLTAIKNVLRESKETDGAAGRASTSSLSPVPEHVIPQATLITRSGSAPPYTFTHHHAPSHSQLSHNLTRDDDAEGNDISDDLTRKFSPSFSFVDTPSTVSKKDLTSVNNTLTGPEVPTPPSNSPQLAFGGYDGSVRQASSTDRPGTAVRSSSVLREERGNGTSSYLPSSPTINPFASQSSSSLGEPDGTIGYKPSFTIVLPSPHDTDPWSSLTRGKKPISEFNSNPWALGDKWGS